MIAVEPEADDSPARETGAQAAEGTGVLVDDGDTVSAVLQRARELAANPPTSDDHDVHDSASRPKLRRRMLRRSPCPK